MVAFYFYLVLFFAFTCTRSCNCSQQWILVCAHELSRYTEIGEEHVRRESAPKKSDVDFVYLFVEKVQVDVKHNATIMCSTRKSCRLCDKYLPLIDIDLCFTIETSIAQHMHRTECHSKSKRTTICCPKTIAYMRKEWADAWRNLTRINVRTHIFWMRMCNGHLSGGNLLLLLISFKCVYCVCGAFYSIWAANHDISLWRKVIYIFTLYNYMHYSFFLFVARFALFFGCSTLFTSFSIYAIIIFHFLHCRRRRCCHCIEAKLHI